MTAANARGATLVRADLTGSALRQANFADVRMDRAVLREAGARRGWCRGRATASVELPWR
ncbi:MAG: pentapeptide repeat-containing protein [Rhodovibrio sp.]|nr:pentapeptide repeat-containing protein [Rhodovibrio sp.]